MNVLRTKARPILSQGATQTLTQGQRCWRGVWLRILLLFVSLGGFYSLSFTAVAAAPLQATAITGPISTNTTWTKANSPYQVTGSITLVPQGLTLTIEPGVTVIFASNTPLIQGHLVANGTQVEPILFTSVNKTPGGWGGLRIQSVTGGARAGVELRHLISEYGGLTNATNGGHLQLTNADAIIANVTFRQGGSHGIAMTLDSNAAISDSTFTGNGRTVVAISTAATTGSAHIQNLAASGNGTDAITFDNLRILNTHYTLHNAGIPYRIAVLTVEKSAKLTVAPGTQVQLQGSPVVRGELSAMGLAGSPITFSGVNPVAGSWNGLQITGDSQQLAHATFDYVVLESGGVATSSQTGNLKVSTAVVTVTNSIVRGGGNYGIYVQSNDNTQRHGLAVTDSEISGHPAGAIFVSDAQTAPTLQNLTLRDNGENAIIHAGSLAGEHYWPNNGVPRVIRSLVTLLSGSRLVIDPGVVVRFENTAALDVQGTLQAIGAPGQPVVFTGTQEQPGWWRTIRAMTPTSVLRLRDCAIGYGGAQWSGFANGMIHLGGSALIQNCRLHHSTQAALFVDLRSLPLIQYNRFEANATGFQTRATSGVPIDGRNNWWGDPSGPTHASNPSGIGNSVVGNVLFKPWLTDPNETGELSGKLVLNLTGPRQFAPGARRLYTLYYANLSDQPIHDGILRVLLPGHAEYVEHTGNATRWPQRHELFWKLETLAPGADGVVTVRVRFAGGLPATVNDGIVAQLSGSNLPNKPFDEAPYLSYVSPLPATERDLTPAEVAAERAAHPALAQSYDQAVAEGYRLGNALIRQYNNGERETQITLLRTQPRLKAYYIWRHGDNVIGGELDGSGFTVRRGGQSMHFDVASGKWGAVTNEVRAANEGIDWSACMENCIIEKLPGNLLEKASSGFNITVKAIDCIKALQGDEGSLLDCAKSLEKVVPGIGEGIDLGKCNADCQQCTGSCSDGRCHCCTTDKKFCDNDDWFYGIFSISVKKQQRCALDTGRYLAPEVYDMCPDCYRCIQNGDLPTCVGKGTSLNATTGLALTQAPDGGDATQTTCDFCRPGQDPNDMVGPLGDLLPGQTVTYTINYENVGAGDAFDVFIVNKLSQHFDPTTLHFSSNNAVYSPDTRSIYWTVGDLAPKGQPGSKGAVTYSVQLKPGLLSSTVISNSAVVHFPSVPEETPTNVVINLIQPLAADPLILTTDAGQVLNFTLSGRDIQNAPLTYALVEGPKYGTLSGNPPALRYTPGEGFSGQDRVVFTVNNGVATSNSADVQIEVKPNAAADRIAPTVINTTPADGGTALVSTVALPTPDGPIYGPRIAAVFSEALDPATITANAVTVTSGGQAVDIMVRYNGTTDQIEILLRTPLQVNALYQVEVNPTVADRVGNRLAAAYTWNFTAVDATPPPAPVTLTVQVNPPAGGTVSGQGIDCGTDCTEGFTPNAQVILAATAAAGYTFSGWNGACSGTAGCTVLMDGAKTVAAAFAPVQPTHHPLTVTVSGQGTVTGLGIDCGGDCSESYAAGESVTLTATAAPGHLFTGWSGACAGADLCQVTMDSAKSVVAAFTPIQTTNYLLTVTVTGQGVVSGQGIDCGVDCSESYGAGTVVNLTATPAPGHLFTGWSGVCMGADLCQVTMDSAQSIGVTFAPVSSGGELLYLSSSKNGTVGGLRYNDEDILAFDPASGQWRTVWDGSDVRITQDTDDFALLADGSTLMSFENPVKIAGILGRVEDADIVRFVPTALGQTTAGRFELYFDGSDVGLTTNNEDIDAFAVLPDGSLLISTRGSASVPGATAGNADLLRFTPTTLGVNTVGTWALYFRGSDVGFDGKESIRSVWVAADGALHLTSDNNFSLAGGFSGDGNDIFVCTPGSLGVPTACTFSRLWDGAAFGFPALIDGLDRGPALSTVTIASTAPAEAEEHDEGDLVDDSDELNDNEPAEEAETERGQIFLPIVNR